MLVTFRTEVHADILMFGDVAVELLKHMGHSGTVPGALQAAEVPVALERLRHAVAAFPAPPAKVAQGLQDDETADELPVDLARRAFPLIGLLEAAATAKCDVLWDR